MCCCRRHRDGRHLGGRMQCSVRSSEERRTRGRRIIAVCTPCRSSSTCDDFGPLSEYPSWGDDRGQTRLPRCSRQRLERRTHTVSVPWLPSWRSCLACAADWTAGNLRQQHGHACAISNRRIICLEPGSSRCLDWSIQGRQRIRSALRTPLLAVGPASRPRRSPLAHCPETPARCRSGMPANERRTLARSYCLRRSGVLACVSVERPAHQRMVCPGRRHGLRIPCLRPEVRATDP